jgi:peptide/nickel transport system ATP-binding protein
MQTLKEKFGISYIYITHDLSTARYVGDDLAIMKAGKIVEMGPIDRLLANPVHPYTKQLISAIPEIKSQSQ